MTERSVIFDFVVDLIIRTALVFSLFLLFTGHNAPGGGFVAGLVAGIALVLRYAAGGTAAVAEALPVRAQTMLGIGLALALGTGTAGWIWGDDFLESAKFERTLPLLGTVKTTSALPFDVGVFLVVLGLAAMLVLALGDSEEPQ